MNNTTFVVWCTGINYGTHLKWHVNFLSECKKCIYSEAPKSKCSDFGALKICPITKLSRFQPVFGRSEIQTSSSHLLG